MKHLLITTIAAVVLVGCGSAEADLALIDACELGNIEDVKECLADGANVNAKDNQFGWTPLHVVVQVDTLDDNISERFLAKT